MLARRKPDVPFIGPGHSFIAHEATWLWSVVGSGIVVTIFDRRRKCGGMAHYCRPRREPHRPSTALYAAPAIVSLVGMLLKQGSHKHDLEAQLYGGASHPGHSHYTPGIHDMNLQVGLELLGKLGVTVTGLDIGGQRGRKIAFHTGSGETAVARINHIRGSDWYPQLEA